MRKRGGIMIVFCVMMIASLWNILMSAQTSMQISASQITSELFFTPTIRSSSSTTTTSAEQLHVLSTTKAATSTNTNTNATILEQIQWNRQMLEERLPKWVIEYIDWQQSQLSTMTKDNWNSGRYKFLILRCTKSERTCGGLSDRIKPVLYLIRIAYESKRIFQIRWDRPCRLEEFLMPTQYFNWSVPDYEEQELVKVSTTTREYFLQQKSNKATNVWGYNKESKELLADAKSDIMLLETKKQVDDGGQTFFKLLMNASGTNDIQDYLPIYPGLFRALFQPSPGVARLLENQMNILGLIPGQYTVAHYRSFYAKTMDQVSNGELEKFASNAINCASNLQPGSPIFFASDSKYASDHVIKYAQTYNLPNIYSNKIIQDYYDSQNITINARKDPLHLEFASKGNKTWPVEAYYDIFVDILVLGNSRCISYGKGGYGVFANMLSFDPYCMNTHTKRGGRMVACNSFNYGTSK